MLNIRHSTYGIQCIKQIIYRIWGWSANKSNWLLLKFKSFKIRINMLRIWNKLIAKGTSRVFVLFSVVKIPNTEFRIVININCNQMMNQHNLFFILNLNCSLSQSLFRCRDYCSCLYCVYFFFSLNNFA